VCSSGGCERGRRRR